MPEARIPIALRWRDMDMLGHLNQAVYHELLEEGRATLFESALGAQGTFPFVIVRVELDYKAEVRHDHGAVDIVARVQRVGRTSVILEQEVVRADGVVAASGITVIVAWDPHARAARELSDSERAALGGDDS